MRRVIFILFSPDEQLEGGGALPDFFSSLFFPLFSRPRAELTTVKSCFFGLATNTTGAYYHRENPFECHEEVCLCSLRSHLNVLTFSSLTGGCSEGLEMRSDCSLNIVQIFL